MITPEQLAACGTEHGEQSALFCWASTMQTAYPELRSMFAIPNGGERNKATAGRLKAEGVKAGVSDIFLPVARFKPAVPGTRGSVGIYHGLFIEMKRALIKPKKDELQGATPAQCEFIELVRERSYAACVCHGWIVARDVILMYLALNR